MHFIFKRIFIWGVGLTIYSGTVLSDDLDNPEYELAAAKKVVAPKFQNKLGQLQSGYKAYIDTNTGKLVYSPETSSSSSSTATRIPLSLETQLQLSTSEVGLYEEIRYRGGYKVNVKGRFRHATAITLNGAKNPLHLCVGNQPFIDASTGNPLQTTHP